MGDAALASNVNYEAMVLTTFARVQKSHEAQATTARVSREDWRDYGEALNGLRTQYRSDKLFGAAVKTLGADGSPCSAPEIRTAAMWLASHWSTLNMFKVDLRDAHNPILIRRMCRNLGFAWAKTQKPRKAKPLAGERITAAAAALPAPMRERFNVAVEHARESLRAEFQKQFRAAVLAEVERCLPDEIKQERERARELLTRAHRMLDDFTARRDAVPKAMTREQWRMVLNCLHPDRAPEDRRERYAEAFATVKRLESCLT